MLQLDQPQLRQSWVQLRRAAQEAGYSAILLGGGAMGAALASLERPLEELLQAAEQEDLSDLDKLPPAREGASSDRMDTLERLARRPPLWVALVPVPQPWMAAAALAWFQAAGEGTPTSSRAAAVARRWQERYGARLALVRPATLGFEIDPSADLAQLAAEAIALAPEEHEGADELLTALHHGAVLRCWWD